MLRCDPEGSPLQTNPSLSAEPSLSEGSDTGPQPTLAWPARATRSAPPTVDRRHRKAGWQTSSPMLLGREHALRFTYLANLVFIDASGPVPTDARRPRE